MLFALKPCSAIPALMVSQALPLRPRCRRGDPRRGGPDIWSPRTRSARWCGPVWWWSRATTGSCRNGEALPPGGLCIQTTTTTSPTRTVSLRAGFECGPRHAAAAAAPVSARHASRSRWARLGLVAFSNDRIYGKRARPRVPGRCLAAPVDCLRHVVVTQVARPGQKSSVATGVAEVERLILRGTPRTPLRGVPRCECSWACGATAERVDLARARASTGVRAGRSTAFFAEDARGAVLRLRPGAGAGRRAGVGHCLSVRSTSAPTDGAPPVGPAAARHSRSKQTGGRRGDRAKRR